ncbi:MAG: type I secretion C-terminal target domain-containing protein [Desmonostoc vinosum HA7617-LM4]|jgi:predicted outer membrane repeat protein|nr:type I secretion C-terminal target domain-containing protein [Desmonostoc vinosum HA7617-LM4]
MSIINVTNINDSGSGSLRDAIAQAKAGDTIKFAANLANKTITLTSGQIELNKDLIIDGSDAANIAISGNKASRIFNTTMGIKLNLQSLSFIDGRAVSSDPKSEIRGGAINLNHYSNLTVSDCSFKDNISNRGGALHVGRSCVVQVLDSTFDNNDGSVVKNGFSAGAIAAGSSGLLTIKNSKFTNNVGVSGGAVYKLLGPLVVEDSVFLNNSSFDGGGAIYTDGANPAGTRPTPETVGGTIRISGSWFEGNQTIGAGGALSLYIYNPDKVIVENSTIINNRVKPTSKGVALGGGLRANGNVTVRNVTFANNISEGQGGGLWVDGDSTSRNAHIKVENSTFSGNQAITSKGVGGAIAMNPPASAKIDIINSTIVDNYAQSYGGAVWSVGKGPVTLTNSIVANNTANNLFGLAQQTVYQLLDGGGNIEFPSPINSKNKKVTAGSLVANPKVGYLRNMDGVLMHSLSADSPAINAGVVAVNAPTTDGRNLTRDGDLDIGAFEFGATGTGSSRSQIVLAAAAKWASNFNKPTAGRDILTGTYWSDRITGLGGRDVLTGGSGNDQFIYTHMRDIGDTITDFQVGKDKIVLTELLDSLSYTGSDPINDGYIKILQGVSPTNFIVHIDPDGPTGTELFKHLVTVNVTDNQTFNNPSNFVF